MAADRPSRGNESSIIPDPSLSLVGPVRREGRIENLDPRRGVPMDRRAFGDENRVSGIGVYRLPVVDYLDAPLDDVFYLVVVERPLDARALVERHEPAG